MTEPLRFHAPHGIDVRSDRQLSDCAEALVVLVGTAGLLVAPGLGPR